MLFGKWERGMEGGVRKGGMDRWRDREREKKRLRLSVSTAQWIQ